MITGQDFIQCADEMCVSGSREAILRTSICRSYYGAYHVAWEMLRLVGIEWKGKSGDQKHQAIRDLWQHSGNNDAIDAADELGDLHELRKLADYKIRGQDGGRKRDADQALAQAYRIRDLLYAACADKQNRENMAENIRKRMWRWRGY